MIFSFTQKLNDFGTIFIHLFWIFLLLKSRTEKYHYECEYHCICSIIMLTWNVQFCPDFKF